jgi:chromosome partitioning protein
VGSSEFAKPPQGTTHVVLDTPGGLRGSHLNEILPHTHKLIVPLQPSVFDIFATRAFLDKLAEHRQARKIQVGIVGMRVDARTLAADKLREFVQSLGLPVLGYLRDTQNYIHMAAHGLTLFDVAPSRVEKDLAQWQSICEWLDA